MGKTEDLARPERILPKEPGWWWCQPYRCCEPEIREVWLSSMEGRGLVFFREIDPPSDSEQVGPGDDVTWLAPIPTPEQLAAVTAKLAAGQALADVVRRWQAADELWRDLKHGDDLRAAGGASNLMFEAESALRTVDHSAFPAGGAR